MAYQLLLVDDSATMHRAVQITFACEGFGVTAVTSPQEALARARDTKFDVALVDVHLAGADGYSVCQALKAEPGVAAAPVLLLGNNSEPIDEGRAQSAGAAGHMLKPFETQALIDRVKTLVGAPVSAGRPAVTATPAQAPRPAAPSAPQAAPSFGAAAGFTPIAAPKISTPAVTPFTASGRPTAAAPSSPFAPPQTATPRPLTPAAPAPGFTALPHAPASPFSSPSQARPAAAPAGTPTSSFTLSAGAPAPLQRPAAPARPAAPQQALHPAAAPAQPTARPTGFPAAPVAATPGFAPAAAQPAWPAAPAPTAPPRQVPAAAPFAPSGPGYGMPDGTPPVTAAGPSQAPVRPAVASALAGLDENAVRAIAREIIERIAWDVVPELAETIIREQLERQGRGG